MRYTSCQVKDLVQNSLNIDESQIIDVEEVTIANQVLFDDPAFGSGNLKNILYFGEFTNSTAIPHLFNNWDPGSSFDIADMGDFVGFRISLRDNYTQQLPVFFLSKSSSAPSGDSLTVMGEAIFKLTTGAGWNSTGDITFDVLKNDFQPLIDSGLPGLVSNPVWTHSYVSLGQYNILSDFDFTLVEGSSQLQFFIDEYYTSDTGDDDSYTGMAFVSTTGVLDTLRCLNFASGALSDGEFSRIVRLRIVNFS